MRVEKTDLNDPSVHVPSVEEESIKVGDGWEKAAVRGDITVTDGAVMRHEWFISETKPGIKLLIQ